MITGKSVELEHENQDVKAGQLMLLIPKFTIVQETRSGSLIRATDCYKPTMDLLE